MKTKKTVLKATKRDQVSVQSFSLTAKDLKIIRANARRYTNGNVSAWLRYASMNYVPKKNELA